MLKKQVDILELSSREGTRVIDGQNSLKPRKQIKSGRGYRMEIRGVFGMNLREQHVKGSW